MKPSVSLKISDKKTWQKIALALRFARTAQLPTATGSSQALVRPTYFNVPTA